MKRAKNFEGLLAIVAEATQTLRENHRLLGRARDTDSVMAERRTAETLASVEFLGRDLASGIVDLEATPFDAQAHKQAFDGTAIRLADDPERRVNPGRRASDRVVPEVEREIAPPVVPPERAAFDFEGGELKSPAQHREECDEIVAQPSVDIMSPDFEFPKADGPSVDETPTVPIIPPVDS